MLHEVYQSVLLMRSQIKQLSFDFHGCFYYDNSQPAFIDGVVGDPGGIFKQHKTLYAFSTKES